MDYYKNVYLVVLGSIDMFGKFALIGLIFTQYGNQVTMAEVPLLGSSNWKSERTNILTANQSNK